MGSIISAPTLGNEDRLSSFFGELQLLVWRVIFVKLVNVYEQLDSIMAGRKTNNYSVAQ